MTPERHQQLAELYQAVLELAPERRAAFLDHACAGDSELRREMESLIAFQSQAEQFIEQPALEMAALEFAARHLAEEHGNALVGQRLNQYEVLAPLGAGGMGEVFLAEDTRLRRKVALKLLPLRFTADQDRLRRFEQEARAASALNHPSILTIHEIAECEGRHYIATEFVEGQTLRQRLASGPMAQAEALNIAIQTVSALAAAHDAGIVHRDIKPENLMLRSDGYVKVLDFGLAKLTESRSANRGLWLEDATTIPQFAIRTPQSTAPGVILGTARYMSPEQARGLNVDARTDLFSLGIVLHEMFSGQPPFTGSTTADVIAAILHYDPPSLPPGTPNALQSIVIKALQKEIPQRYQTADELLADLKKLQSEWEFEARLKERESAPVPTIATRLPRHWLAAGFILILLLGLAGYVYSRFAHQAADRHEANPTQVTGRVASRRSIAVLGFRNLSGRAESAWLSTALAEMFSADLAAGDRLRAIPGETIARMKVELALAEADSLAPETLARIRHNLGADLVVTGAYTILGEAGKGRLRLDLRLQDATTGEAVATLSGVGEEATLFELVSQTGARLREKLGFADLSATEASDVQAALPTDAEAARLYSEGLQRLRLSDAIAARDLLQRAIRIEPGYSLAHTALASAWSRLGYEVKAREEVKQAFDLSKNLSRETQLIVEGRYREANHEPDKAVEIYRTLFGFFPDNLEHGLRLAKAQANAGHGQDAYATLEALRRLPSLNDARVEIAEGDAADSLGDYRRELAAAQRAHGKAVAQGASMLVAEARYYEGWSEWQLGQHDKALAAYAEARSLYAAAGNRNSVADIINATAIVWWDRGDLDAAARAFDEALAIKRQLGNRGSTAALLNNLANIDRDRAQLTAATRRYSEALGIYRELGRRTELPGTLNNLATALKDKGELAQAAKVYEEAIAIGREIGKKDTLALALQAYSEVIFDQGNLPRSRQMNEEALALARSSGRQLVIANALRGLAHILRAEDKLTAAKRQYEAALAIFKSAKPDEVQPTRLELAAVAIAQGQFTEAETVTREAIAFFQSQSDTVTEAQAQSLLAQSLLAQHKLAEAKTATDRAIELTRHSEDHNARTQAALITARIQAAAGRSPEALRHLQALLAEAASAGYVNDQFELRLALGEIEIHSGNLAAGRGRLTPLIAEAQAKGFNLIARKARSILERQN